MQVSTSKKFCKDSLALPSQLHTLTSFVTKNAEKTVDLLGIFISATLSWTQMDLKE